MGLVPLDEPTSDTFALNRVAAAHSMSPPALDPGGGSVAALHDDDHDSSDDGGDEAGANWADLTGQFNKIIRGLEQFDDRLFLTCRNHTHVANVRDLVAASNPPMIQTHHLTEAIRRMKQQHKAESEELRRKFGLLAAAFEQLGSEITTVANRGQEIHLLEQLLINEHDASDSRERA